MEKIDPEWEALLEQPKQHDQIVIKLMLNSAELRHLVEGRRDLRSFFCRCLDTADATNPQPGRVLTFELPMGQ